MKKYLEVSVSGSPQQREVLIPSLAELGCTGFQETDTHLIGYFPMPRSPEESAGLRDALLAVLRRISSNADITFGEIDERNWNLEWERTIGPVDIGRRITVQPSWRSDPAPPGRIVLTIDPKMSFGTGYHETTRLMVRLIESYIVPGTVVYDIGTGTGILAIAAVKLGARTAYGTDTDEWSVANALENLPLNGVQDRVRIAAGTFPPASADPPGMICANLTLNDLKGLLPEFSSRLTPGGLLLVSGLLVSDGDDISDALRVAGFRHMETLTENEWIAVCSGK